MSYIVTFISRLKTLIKFCSPLWKASCQQKRKHYVIVCATRGGINSAMVAIRTMKPTMIFTESIHFQFFISWEPVDPMPSNLH